MQYVAAICYILHLSSETGMFYDYEDDEDEEKNEKYPL